MPDEIARNEAAGEFTHLLQAGTVNGEVHFHAPHTARPGRSPRPVTEWGPFDLDVHRIRVAERFSDEDLETLRSTGSVDPRISLAVSSAGKARQVIQTLAGGPALVDRHEHPDTTEDRYAAAIVTAVIDAHHLGHRSLLPRTLLADAAPGYLDERDRIDAPADWFERGIRCAAEESLHGITALIPRRRQAGTGPADGYELHDYIEQHGQAVRRAALVPDSLVVLAQQAAFPDARRLLRHGLNTDGSTADDA
ncbi:hypothetical protein [Saccharopolyspora shandongensis]|uniref:hypothetical protein n=1 Tax=Saccharopolyspora shandongensis TaxID=418495 RepID=UPI00340E3FB6